MTEGTQNAIPAINMTLHITSKVTFVVHAIPNNDIILIINDVRMTFLTPIRSLKRPASKANSMPKMPYSFALIAVVWFPPTISEVI